MNDLMDTYKAKHGHIPIVSIGPQMETSHTEFIKSLRSFTNPSAKVLAPAIEDFKTHDIPRPDICRPDSPAAARAPSSLLFFEPLPVNAAIAKLPSLAPRVASGWLCCRRIQIACFDPLDKQVRVNVDSMDGSASIDLTVISPGMLTREELESMRIWHRSDVLYYYFGVAVPKSLKSVYNSEVPKFCRSTDAGETALYTLHSTLDPDKKKQSLVEWLVREDIIGKVSQDANSSSWRLSSCGRRKLVAQFEVHVKRKVLKHDDECDVMGADAFQLISLMHSQSWICHVKTRSVALRKKGAKKIVPDASAKPDCVPYKVGGDKVFWIKRDSKGHDVWYLRALLRAPNHGQAVPHLAKSSAYMALLGVEPTRKKQLVDFKFSAERKIKRQRVQRVVTKPGAPLAIADVSSGISSHDGEESQSSSSSSSESSSDVSVQSSSEHVDLGDAPAPTPPPLFLATRYWKTFKFTTKKNREAVPIGLEVSCYCAAHRPKGSKLCTRTMSFAVGGGADLTERKLKWWCLQAFRAPPLSALDSKALHQGLPKHPDDLPIMEALDALEVPLEHALEVHANVRQRVASDGI